MKVFKKYTKDEMALKYFNGAYFWDCEKEKIKLKKNYQIIIERVLSQSLELEKDLIKLNNFYFTSKIKNIALSSGQIYGNERINYISKRYNLNPLDFINFYKENLYS